MKPKLTTPTKLTGAIAGALVAAAASALPPLDAELVVSGLRQPLFATHVQGDERHLLVLERTGKLKVVDIITSQTRATPVLDLSSLVRLEGDGGVLGAAVAPGTGPSRALYIYYTSGAPGASPSATATLARYTLDVATLVAAPASAQIILQYNRPRIGHNGGWIGFSPVDGYLYISLGDGGSAGTLDPTNASQTTSGMVFQGKVLRIDPAADAFASDPNRNYTIPADNPFVGTANDAEIWAYGLRNPWRCSFDRATGDLWVADVGEDAYEEVNIIPAGAGGGNYGWRCMEGPDCTGADPCPCPPSIAPSLTYNHDLGLSITGGYVYSGQLLPGLVGTYIFADFQLPKLFAYTPGGSLQNLTPDIEPQPVTSPRVLANLAAFGEDSRGEIYFMDFFNGRLFKIVPQLVVPPPGCYADINNDGGVDGTDIEFFFVAWAGSETAADTNEDGGVDGSDVETFFIQWSAGGC